MTPIFNPTLKRVMSVILGFVMVIQVMPANVSAQRAPIEITAEQVPSMLADGIIVKYEPGCSFGDSEIGVQSLGPSVTQVIEVPEGQDMSEMLMELQEDPAVVYAEPNYLFWAQSTPNDPDFSEQWALGEIDAPEAWALAEELLGDKEPLPVVVAVLDTGVSSSHPDIPLESRLLVGKNMVDNGNNTDDDHSSGHGTHVAGIIAALTNNEVGIAGVAGELPVHILPVKVLDRNGVGTMKRIADAIYWVTDEWLRQARLVEPSVQLVINMSLGGRIIDYPITLGDAVTHAIDNGAIVVAAAGNEGKSIYDDEGKGAFYPASFPGVVAVEASDESHKLWPRSNYHGLVTAPGVSIYSTLPGGNYGNLSGTSQAAAVVSGCVGIIRSVFPDPSSKSQGHVSKTTSQLVDALWDACSVHLVDGKKHYVMNARSTLDILSEDFAPWQDVDILSPLDGTAVMGSVTVSVVVGDPSRMVDLELRLQRLGENPEVLRSFQGPKAEAPGPLVPSGVYTYEWDTGEVSDGYYSLKAVLTSPHEHEGTYTHEIRLSVANERDSGLKMRILKPDGEAAAGAGVLVRHKIDEEPVGEGTASLEGTVVVPGTVATDGNDYSVIAWGTEPAFLYSKAVRAGKGTVDIDSQDTRKLRLSAKTLEGDPLGSAAIYVTFTHEDGYRFDSSVLAVTDDQGLAEITLSPGLYDIFLLGTGQPYLLCQKDFEVTLDSTPLEFSFTGENYATVRVEEDDDLAKLSLRLAPHLQDMHSHLDLATTWVVTPGRYWAEISYENEGEVYTWYKEIVTPSFSVSSGDEKTLFFGGPISIEMESPIITRRPGSVVCPFIVKDEYGNKVEKVIDPRKPNDFPGTIEILSPSGRSMQVNPYVSFGNGQMEVNWFVSYDYELGTYTVNLTPRPSGTGGSCEVNVVDDNRPYIVLRGLYGEELKYAHVCYYRIDEENSMTVLEYDDYSNYDGRLNFYFSDSGYEYAVSVLGTSQDPDSDAEKNFLIFQPLSFEHLEALVDAREHASELVRVVLSPDEIYGDGVFHHFASGSWDTSMPYLAYLGSSAGDHEVYMKKGEYHFSALSSLAALPQASIPDEEFPLNLTLSATVPEDLDAQDVLHFEAQELASLRVSCSGESPFFGGVALFPEGAELAPTIGRSFGETILLVPGRYKVLAAIADYDVDWQPWSYWFQKEIEVEAGGEYNWELELSLGLDLHLEFSSLAIGDILESSNIVKDSMGNRLVALASIASIGGAEPVSEMGSQDHPQIAPFFSVVDPQGKELMRYKDFGSNQTAMDMWRQQFRTQDYFRTLFVAPFPETSSYFGSKYQIPVTARPGAYEAVLEFGSGPQGLIEKRASFAVSTGTPPPVLVLPVSPTNAQSITLQGTAALDARVEIRYRVLDGEWVDAGWVMSHGVTGEFSKEVPLEGVEERYEFAARIVTDLGTSLYSESVFLDLDRKAPESSAGLVATVIDHREIHLEWEASPDDDVDVYILKRDGIVVLEIEETGAAPYEHTDSGLSPDTEYSYEVLARDFAGNLSTPSSAIAKTPSEPDTTPPSPPGNVRIGEVGPGGRVVLEWDANEEEDFYAYLVYRKEGDGEFVLIETIQSLAETTFTDTGLPAETLYTYKVTAVDSSGNESANAGEPTVDLGALEISSVNWRPLSVSDLNGFLFPGSDIAVEVLGDPGREVSGRMSYKSWDDGTGGILFEPEDEEDSLDLTESLLVPGLYQGVWTLPPLSSEVSSARAEMEDGAGHSAVLDSGYSRKRVAGIIPVIVTKDPGVDPEETCRISVWSSGQKCGDQITVSSSGEYELRGLSGARDSYGGAVYDLTVTTSSGVSRVVERRIPVRDGLSSPPVSVIFPGAASLRVTIEDPQGNPIPDVQYSMESDKGTFLSRVSPDGITELVSELLGGQKIEVIATPRDPELLLESTKKTYVMASGHNEVTLTLDEMNTVTLEGTVINSYNGQPFQGASVLVTQTFYDQLWRQRTVRSQSLSDEQGRYSLAVVGGKGAAVSCSNSNPAYSYTQARITTPTSGTMTQDLTVQVLETWQLGVNLTTKYLGSDAETMDWREVDWRVAYHFRFVARAEHGDLALYEYPLLVRAAEGNTVTVTVDGIEAGLPRKQVQVILDKNELQDGVQVVDVELFQEGSGIRAHIEDPYGEAVEDWWAELFRVDGDGNRHIVGKTRGTSSGLSMLSPFDGPHYLEVWDDRDTWEAGLEVDLPQAEMVDLGTIRLSSGGPFGGEGNALQCVGGSGSLGGYLSMRLTFKSDSPKTLENASLLLEIPGHGTSSPQVTLVDRSVTLDGLAVDDGSFLGSFYKIPLGSVDPGQSGVVQYRLVIEEDCDADAILLAAHMRYEEDGVQKECVLATSRVPIAIVTLDAPRNINTLAKPVRLSGTAPAGSTVVLFDGTLCLGEALTSPAGIWREDLYLGDHGSPYRYMLNARVELAGKVYVSDYVRLEYDDREANPPRVTLAQQDGRAIAFDTGEGLARFPYVLVPDLPFIVEVEFPDPSMVRDVSVRIGESSAPAELLGGKFVATVPWRHRPNKIGDVFVTYFTKPSPEVFKREIADLETLRRVLPIELIDLVIDNIDRPNKEVALTVPGTRHGDLKVLVALNAESGISFEEAGITQEDINRAIETGVPVYKTSIEIPEDGDFPNREFIINFEAFIAQDAVTSQGMEDVGIMSSSQLLRFDVTFVASLSSGETLGVADWINTLYDGFGMSSKFEQLGELVNLAANCGPRSQEFAARAEGIARKASAAEAVKWGSTIVVVLLKPDDLGIDPVDNFGVGGAIDWRLDFLIQDEIDDLRFDIEFDPDLKRPTKNFDGPMHHGERKFASPVWIWDPSGYVFEGVPGNRLEGVTAIAQYYDTDLDTWVVWDADWYGQENPLITDGEGRYGWDVPSGDWKVVWHKDGYETAESPSMDVPPPRTEVNMGMVSLASPKVSSVKTALDGTHVEVEFDKYMDTETLADGFITVYKGDVAVDGTVSSVDPVSHETQTLAASAMFEPDAPFEPGESYTLKVSQLVQSYSGRMMEGDYLKSLALVGDVSEAKAVPGDRSLTLTWKDPSQSGLSGIKIYYKGAGDDYGSPFSVAKGIERFTLSGLSNDVLYTVKLVAVNADDAESAGVEVSGRPEAPPSYDSVPSLPAPSPHEQQFVISGGTQALLLADGDLVIRLDEGALPEGTVLLVTTIPGDQVAPEFVPVSLVYDIDPSEGSLSEWVVVGFKYDKELLGDTDPKKLGVYRQNEDNPDLWDYVGGVLDSEGMIWVRLTGFSAYRVMAYVSGFLDMENHWSRNEVEILAARHIVNGVSPTSFQPERPVTRAEFTKMLLGVLGSDLPGERAVTKSNNSTFEDVADDAWYYEAVERAAEAGIVKGDGGIFRPDDAITRQEAAVMITRALNLRTDKTVEKDHIAYEDREDIAPWALEGVHLTFMKGLITGMTKDTVAPLSNTTRAQAAVIILRAMEMTGMIYETKEIEGFLTETDIEGKHYELEVTDGETGTYVLIPYGPEAEELLSLNLDKKVRVKGILTDEMSMYMRGPVLRVLEVERKAE